MAFTLAFKLAGSRMFTMCSAGPFQWMIAYGKADELNAVALPVMHWSLEGCVNDMRYGKVVQEAVLNDWHYRLSCEIQIRVTNIRDCHVEKAMI